MRKLKLQMQITADGFVAGPEGQLDWMTFDLDEKLIGFINHLTDTSDTILLGRKMTDGFIKYWERVVADPAGPEYAFGRKMVDTPKIVFSRTLTRVEGTRREWARASGGQSAQGIENGLIDELNFFVNPVAIGKGMRVFSDRRPLRLTGSTAYQSGIVVNIYAPR